MKFKKKEFQQEFSQNAENSSKMKKKNAYEWP